MAGRTGARAGERGGFFITFEGPEGAGKTTQLGLLARRLQAEGHAVVAVREPGGTKAAERIRELLLDPTMGDLQPRTEAFLVFAARSELVADVIRPSLRQRSVVVCDRHADATLAYQGYGGGVPLDRLRAMNAVATGGLRPDLTLLLDLPVHIGLERRRAHGLEWTRMDAADAAFHERVRAGYLHLSAEEPNRWVVLDARQGPEEVAAAVWRSVATRMASVLPVAERAEGAL